MPTDPSKRVQQILELPPALTPDQLQTTLNDRIRDLNGALGNAVQNPALGQVDLGNFKIINLADPKDDLDTVNLRTLKKFAGTGVAQEVAGRSSGTENPTIYFTFDGFPADGEESPFAIIMANRAGFSPTAIAVSAVGAPTSDCSVNLTIGGVKMLAADLVLPAGSQGPIFSSAFALGAAFPLGTLIESLVIKAGGAVQLTIGLAISGGG